MRKLTILAVFAALSILVGAFSAQAYAALPAAHGSGKSCSTPIIWQPHGDQLPKIGGHGGFIKKGLPRGFKQLQVYYSSRDNSIMLSPTLSKGYVLCSGLTSSEVSGRRLEMRPFLGEILGSNFPASHGSWVQYKIAKVIKHTGHGCGSHAFRTVYYADDKSNWGDKQIHVTRLKENVTRHGDTVTDRTTYRVQTRKGAKLCPKVKQYTQTGQLTTVKTSKKTFTITTTYPRTGIGGPVFLAITAHL